jgi:hypothetical protein
MLPGVKYNLKQFYAKNIVLNVLSFYVFLYIYLIIHWNKCA